MLPFHQAAARHRRQLRLTSVSLRNNNRKRIPSLCVGGCRLYDSGRYTTDTPTAFPTASSSSVSRQSSSRDRAATSSTFTSSSTQAQTKAAVALLVGTTGLLLFANTTFSLPSAALSCDAGPAKDEVEVEVDVDPYENLPEEDEETNCTLCNTFRKGPCRPYWRKLERCFKDHEGEEGGATKCTKYFRPHSTCLQRYTNLYHLVSLETKQELVQDAERAIFPQERRSWQPNVDWTMWQQFANDKDGGLDFCQTNQTTTNNHNKTNVVAPLWQRLPPDTEPVLLTVSSNLPIRQIQDSNNDDQQSLPKSKSNSSRRRNVKKPIMILKIAYAIDQNDQVLGFAYNEEYLNLLQQAQASNKQESSDEAEMMKQQQQQQQQQANKNSTTTLASSAKSKNTVAPAPFADSSGTATSSEATDHGTSAAQQQQAGDDTSNTFRFDFFLMPGETKQVRVCAMYAEDPTKASADKDILDALLYKSAPYSLAKEAKTRKGKKRK